MIARQLFLTPPSRPPYLTPALERLGTWTFATGASACPPGILCVKLNHVLFPTDGGFPR